MKKSKITFFFFAFMCLPLCLFGQSPPSSIVLKIRPAAEIPLAYSSTLYTLGGSTIVTTAYQPPLGLPLYVSADLAYSMVDLSMPGANLLHALSLGSGIGVDFHFLRRLALDIWTKGGFYYAFTRTEEGGTIGGGNPYVWAGGDFSYYLTPSLSLSIGGAYKNYLGKPQSLLSSASVFLGTAYSINLSGGKDMFAPLPAKPSRLDITGVVMVGVETEPIFPVFYQYYDKHPIGRIQLKNIERGSIENLEVSVFIKRYMDSPKIVEVPGEIKRGEEKEIELFALFTDRVLGITEGDTVAAEIKLEYDFKGERKSIERIETVKLHHRNASIWDDDRRAASFVTANDPIVLRFAKNLAGLVRNRENQVIDLHLRTAMAIHQALSLYGISYVVDPNSAYADLVKNRHAVDFLQFPRQTLEYKAGDCDDLSILYCALLEAVSVDTAFITAPGHIYIAFALEMNSETARKTFSEPDNLIFKDDKAWIPLEVTEIDGGFMKAWERGVRGWRENSPSGQSGFYPLSEAWILFKPVGLPGEAEGVSLPALNQVAVVYERELDRFIYLETADRVNRLQSQIAKNKTDSRLINRLGVLFARYGQLSQAEEQFRWAISVREYGPSLVNLGNIYFLHSDYQKALQFYNRAYRVMSGNPAVLLSIAKTYYELGKYEEAEKNYSLLKELSPQLAKDFGYLAKTGSESVRAAEAAKQEALLWEE